MKFTEIERRAIRLKDLLLVIRKKSQEIKIFYKGTEIPDYDNVAEYKDKYVVNVDISIHNLISILNIYVDDKIEFVYLPMANNITEKET